MFLVPDPAVPVYLRNPLPMAATLAAACAITRPVVVEPVKITDGMAHVVKLY